VEGLLAILKLVFLAALYLFLWRVITVVLREMKPAPAVAEPVTVPVAPAPPMPGGAVVLPKGTVGLVILEPVARAGELIPVTAEITIGRAPGCGIAFPEDGTLSSLHARVAPTKKGVTVEDLGSTNGTLVNDTPIAAATTAKRGAQIRCGSAVFEVVT
jgi:pSer/pThr/pTyr-binding forkhead associated (FHA) protein